MRLATVPTDACSSCTAMLSSACSTHSGGGPTLEKFTYPVRSWNCLR